MLVLETTGPDGQPGPRLEVQGVAVCQARAGLLREVLELHRVLAAAGELGVPRIHFGVGTTNLLGLMGEAGADVVGVDWRTPLEQAIPLVGDRVVQGNLDPTLVFAPTEVMTARAAEIIAAGRAAKGHIFNLGHGVIPSTDPGQLTALTDFVHGC